MSDRIYLVTFGTADSMRTDTTGDTLTVTVNAPGAFTAVQRAALRHSASIEAGRMNIQSVQRRKQRTGETYTLAATRSASENSENESRENEDTEASDWGIRPGQ